MQLAVIVEGIAVSLLASLTRGDIDVAICSPVVDDLAPGICQKHLLRDRITVVAYKDHPIHRLPRPTLADLTPYAWVMPSNLERERQTLERALLAAGLPPPRVAVETTSSPMVAQLLDGEQLLAYLPLIALELDSAVRDLRSVPVEIPWRERDLCVFWRDASTTLPAMTTFLECVGSAAGSLDLQDSIGTAASAG
ncbi:MAG: LysR substrate-binding domain-containing protein [Lautropia sp.]